MISKKIGIQEGKTYSTGKALQFTVREHVSIDLYIETKKKLPKIISDML